MLLFKYCSLFCFSSIAISAAVLVLQLALPRGVYCSVHRLLPWAHAWGVVFGCFPGCRQVFLFFLQHRTDQIPISSDRSDPHFFGQVRSPFPRTYQIPISTTDQIPTSSCRSVGADRSLILYVRSALSRSCLTGGLCMYDTCSCAHGWCLPGGICAIRLFLDIS